MWLGGMASLTLAMWIFGVYLGVQVCSSVSRIECCPDARHKQPTCSTIQTTTLHPNRDKVAFSQGPMSKHRRRKTKEERGGNGNKKKTQIH